MAINKSARVSGVFLILVLCFVLWFIVASDYSDSAAVGKYHFAQNGETSNLVLKPDHSFQQEVSRLGQTEHAEGTWRRVGEGGISFSKEFLVVSGDEPEPDGTTFSDMHKSLGLFVSLALRQYHVLWYGKVNSTSDNSVYGTYAGDEEGVPATLVLNADHTFEQTVTHAGITKHAEGSWSYSQNGTIVFSKAFLKTSGEALREDETASAEDPKGSNLQIEIAVSSKTGEPTFQKRQVPW
jgi:hypothetical protein